ncbi:helix-turn-helix domain-containing protein [Streptomyces sp. NBC_01005]|uniref:helix-turn-helix domain-containing protein n=1 Tax=unclassified Streptomyces TaxID=2593676 RepID=UPI002E342076|nr:helix-turn-helix domain-containing protein [Streptomyces sp. NBC_01362]WSW03289.1 helix-turn-helix domain-containing protein [Streptomyces sp. NBC_01005]WTC92791.1 helix-turn-helix domain-containing protein [Streptomyces sp. NBC_01650]
MGDAGALWQVGVLEGLLREAGLQASRGVGPDVRKVLEWLHRQTGVHVALVTDDAGTVESSTAGFPRDVLGTLAPLLVRMSGGQLAAAVTQSGALHVRCEALGPHEPRPVLVVTGPSKPAPDAIALISYTGSVLTLLRLAGRTDRIWHDYQHTTHQLRFAVLSALLSGEPILARRMTTGAIPPLLDADRLRLYLLQCPPADRDRIVRTYQDPSGYHGSGLMVQCPVFKSHLICLLTDDEEPDSPGGKLRGHAETLRRLVRDNPRYAMGVSGGHPLHAAAEAYSQAAHALAAAPTAPTRVASYHGRTPLEGALPHQAAQEWARTLLQPLDTATKTSTDITRLTMNMPRSAVAKLLGLSRNTVTAHLKRTEASLGLDLTDIRCRAALHLALVLSSSHPAPEPDYDQPPSTLDGLLRTERAAAWATATLRPLQARHRRTLQAWIDVNTDAQEAARALGISRNTIRTHLRTVESVLGLDLLTAGTGIHDVVHALHIASIRAI